MLERGETLAEAKPLKRAKGMGPAARGLGFSRSRMLPPEHWEKEVAGEWAGAGRWVGLMVVPRDPVLLILFSSEGSEKVFS